VSPVALAALTAAAAVVAVAAVAWPFPAPVTLAPAAPSAPFTRAVSWLLARLGVATRLAASAAAAGRSGDEAALAVRTLAAASVAAVVGALVSGPVVASLAFAGACLALPLRLRLQHRRRRAAFAAQLPAVLQSLASSLRAGYSTSQALDAAAAMGLSPASEELAAALSEVRIGRPLPDALRAVAARTSSTDLDWVVVALEVNAEMGGSLAELLETVESTLRARESLRRNVRTLSAEGRVSAVMIFALPFVTLGTISVLNPAYVQLLYSGATGWAISATAMVLMAVGGLWLRRVVRVRF
jgi:tight adherence protein B